MICVFGCGGDRDQGKRPLMGQAAAERAFLSVATSDNPRSEDPLAILSQIERGLAPTGKRLAPAEALQGAPGYLLIDDRREAITLALACARPGDVVLIAGKGHETTQQVGAVKRPFDDRREAAAALERLAKSPAGGQPGGEK